MAKSYEKIEARKKRRKGVSIVKIAQDLDVSKGTVSVWCRDIELTESQQRRLMKRSDSNLYPNQLKGAHRQRDQRIARIRDFEMSAKKDIGVLNNRDLLLILAALYWGEGNKKTRNTFVISNSDPDLIRLLLRCLRSLGVGLDRITLRVFINEAHKGRIADVQTYWRKVTDVSEEQFRKSIFIKTKLKKKYENHEEHYGTLRVSVLRSSLLFYRVMGAIHHLGGESLVKWKA